MNFERPDTYRFRLAEGLKKHSSTWKNADLVNARGAEPTLLMLTSVARSDFNIVRMRAKPEDRQSIPRA
jgi:hypothetical protein